MPEWYESNRPIQQVDKKKIVTKKAYSTGVQEQEPATEKKKAPAVRLLNAEWVPGPEGFIYNKKCFLDVKVETLAKTNVTRVTGKLFGIFEGKEVDLNKEVEGHIDPSSSVARIEIKNLYYINTKHYNACSKNPSVEASYFIKKITHSQATSQLESPILEMPVKEEAPSEKGIAHVVRLIGMTFDANKCFLLPHALPGIRSIVQMHQKYKDAAILIVGHDGGDEELKGVDLACCRAEILGAYLTNSIDVWQHWFHSDKPAKIRWGTREVQLMLSCLPDGETSFYIGSASGITDVKTRDAVKKFQTYCNTHLGGKLKVDGIAGPKTQKELIKAYMGIQDTTLSQDAKYVAHGCEGQFEDDLVSVGMQPDERIVEIFFFEKEIAPYPKKKTSLNGSTDYFKWKEQIVDSQNFEFHGIHVQAIDKKKLPIRNAKVILQGPVESTGYTDDQGFAFFSGLIAGEYTVTAEKAGVKTEAGKIKYPTAKTFTRGLPGKKQKGK